jgi:predicted transglutaminase-like cysteine proteinase
MSGSRSGARLMLAAWVCLVSLSTGSGSAKAEIAPAASPPAETASPDPTAPDPMAPGAAGPELDQSLRDLLAEPMPQAAPNVFGYQAVLIPTTAFDGAWDMAQAGDTELGGEWAALIARLRGASPRAATLAVNTFVNRRVARATDQDAYGEPDYWASLTETVGAGRGDCEDFAIAKMQLLKMAGVPANDLYLLLVRDVVREADHAVLLVRLGDDLLVLDSEVEAVRPAEAVRGYRPVASYGAVARWRFAAAGAAKLEAVSP